MRRTAFICAVALAAAGCGVQAAASGLVKHPSAAARTSPAKNGVDWSRFDFDAQRSGVGPASTGITAANLHQLHRRVVHLDGTVDSAAIELHGVRVAGRSRDVLFVTTTYGRTLALDAASGARLWQYTPADIGSYAGSSQITTATPVSDPDRRYIYAASPDGRIHKLSVATGHEVHRGHWPARVTFDPTHEKIPAALNIDGGYVVVTTGGYIGDAQPYQGHVLLIDRSSGALASVWNSLCSNRRSVIDPPSSCGASDAAIWARAGAVIEPGGSRILVATGNTPFNGTTNWGESVLELSVPGLRLLHNWTPTNQAQLSNHDGDVGSTAPALLGSVGGMSLALQGGKQGVLDLLDLNRLDGTTGRASARQGGQLQQLPTPAGTALLTTPAVWTSAGRTYVFVADDSATAAYVLGGGVQPRLTLAWQANTGGTSPVVAGGLLYVYDPGGGLRVYTPTSGHLLAELPAGRGHWNSPIVDGGRIILPEGDSNQHRTSGILDIYSLPGG